MNFLIAILSNTLAAVLKDEHVIMTAQRLSVITTVEYAMLTMPYTLVNKYYSHIKPKWFTIEDNKVYLVTTTIENTEKDRREAFVS